MPGSIQDDNTPQTGVLMSNAPLPHSTSFEPNDTEPDTENESNSTRAMASHNRGRGRKPGNATRGGRRVSLHCQILFIYRIRYLSISKRATPARRLSRMIPRLLAAKARVVPGTVVKQADLYLARQLLVPTTKHLHHMLVHCDVWLSGTDFSSSGSKCRTTDRTRYPESSHKLRCQLASYQ